MSKPIFGLILGAILGVFDGLTSLFYPEVTASQLPGILFFSSLKGLIGGFVIGFFACKVDSLGQVIIFGGFISLLLAFLVALAPDESGKYYFAEIMLPGGIVGLIIGFAIQKFGQSSKAV